MLKITVRFLMLCALLQLVFGCSKGGSQTDKSKNVPSVLIDCVLAATGAFTEGKSTYESPTCKVEANRDTDNDHGQKQEVVRIAAKKQVGNTEHTVYARFPANWLTTEKENLAKVKEQSKLFMEHFREHEMKEKVQNSGVATNPINQPANDKCTLGSWTHNDIPGFFFECKDTPVWGYVGSYNK